MITKYYHALDMDGVVGKPEPSVYAYKSRSKKKMKAAFSATNQEPGFPQLKVAVFPYVPSGAKVHDYVNNGKVMFTKGSKHELVRIFLFKDYEKTPGEFADNPEAVVKKILKECKGADAVKFITGGRLQRGSQSVSKLIDELNRYMETYGPEQRAERDTWDKWLDGIEAHWFKNQKKPKKSFKRKSGNLGRGKNHGNEKATPGKVTRRRRRGDGSLPIW